MGSNTQEQWHKDITVLCVLAENPKMPEEIYRGILSAIKNKSARAIAEGIRGKKTKGEILRAVGVFRDWAKRNRERAPLMPSCR